MKKLLVVLSLLLFVFSFVYAEFPTDKSKKIGFVIDDVDKLVMEVHDNNGDPGTKGEVIDKVSLSGKSTSSSIDKYFLFNITVTSSHKIKLKLSTKGPLTLENGTETIDYSLIHIGTYNNDDEGTAAKCALLGDWYTVFGTDFWGEDKGYNETDYCVMGTNGYLNINDPIWGWFYISVNKSDIIGKSIGTYVTYIYLTAETTS